jgi:Asp-tRNA(Asn)/Glu-tRNA(Gln) amidotransferase B subunit
VAYCKRAAKKKRGKNKKKVDLFSYTMSSLASLINSVKANTVSNTHLKNSVKRKSSASRYELLLNIILR